MIIENKKKIQEYLEQLPDKYLNEILEYMHFLEFKSRNENADISSMFLSENSLAKEWLTRRRMKRGHIFKRYCCYH